MSIGDGLADGLADLQFADTDEIDFDDESKYQSKEDDEVLLGEYLTSLVNRGHMTATSWLYYQYRLQAGWRWWACRGHGVEAQFEDWMFKAISESCWIGRKRFPAHAFKYPWKLKV